MSPQPEITPLQAQILAKETKEAKTNEPEQPKGNPPEKNPEGETAPATPEAPAEGEQNPPEGEPGKVAPAETPSIDPNAPADPANYPPTPDPNAPEGKTSPEDPPVPAHQDLEISAKYPENDAEAVALAVELISLLAQLKRREAGGAKTVRIVKQIKQKIDLVTGIILAYDLKKGVEEART